MKTKLILLLFLISANVNNLPAQWLGYEVTNNWVNTQNWLGWVYVGNSPWIYSPRTEWNYVNLSSKSKTGAWIYTTRREELLIYQWDAAATKEDSGFLQQRPPLNNIDFTTPIDYTTGTIYVRAVVRSMPVRKDMVVRLFWWQNDVTPEGEQILRESGISGTNGLYLPVRGTTGDVVVTGQFPFVEELVSYGGGPIKWDTLRSWSSLLIAGPDGYKKITDKGEQNWNGENPDEWYPLDIHFTAVLVAKESTFSGWQNYISDTAE